MIKSCLIWISNPRLLNYSFCTLTIRLFLTLTILNHNLQLNTNKTNIMHFRTKCTNIYEPQISLDETIIESCQKTKFLGIIIDNELKWSHHTDYLSKKLNTGIYILKRIAQICSYEAVLSVYHSLFMSHISYDLWGSCKIDNLNSIFLIQKRAIRYLFGLNKTDSCKKYFKDHGLLTVPSVYIY